MDSLTQRTSGDTNHCTLEDIWIRDPFILEDGGVYYLYGTKDKGKFYVYTSVDLTLWQYAGVCFTAAEDFWGNDKTNYEQAFWAPEVFKYKGAYYMFATFTQPGTGDQQATTVLKADSPLGPFEEWSDGPITPAGCSCLDGTLCFEDGKPYMVYVHEWQCECKHRQGVGSMGFIQLTDDLRATVGEPREWFTAAEFTGYTEAEVLAGKKNTGLTDGPFVYETKGQKYLLWSTTLLGKYIQVATRFDKLGANIDVKNDSVILYPEDGGHGMIFTDKDGNDLLVLHTPNRGEIRVELFRVDNSGGVLSLKKGSA